MKTVFKGKVWKFGDNISTDLMMPGHIVLARKLSDEDAAPHCFSSNRPGWVDEVQPGDIIVAGRNFGCGSSRNGARMLQLNGVSVVLAESTSRIFLRSSVNVGMPALWCQGVFEGFDEGDEAEVDLVTGTAKNLTKHTALQAEPWPEDSPPMQILRAGGLLPFIKNMMKERGMKPPDS